jgi:VWFA-related protein
MTTCPLVETRVFMVRQSYQKFVAYRTVCKRVYDDAGVSGMILFNKGSKSAGVVCGIVLSLCAIVALGQSRTESTDARVLNVTALDEKGKPVTDLTSADFQIFDDDKPQIITGFTLLLPPDGGKTPPTTLILFDLLNVFAGQRDNSATLIVHAVQPLGPENSIYLYLLTNHGELYNVHDPTSLKAPEEPWTKQVRLLLDQAIAKVNALRIQDYKDEGVSAAATFLALNQIGDAFTKIPGPKSIIWITRGAENRVDYRYGCKDVQFPDGLGSYIGGRCGEDCVRRVGVGKCVDYSAFLQRYAGRLTRSDTIFYSVMVDPEGSLYGTDRGRPKDTLVQLADLTGGRLYPHGDVDNAITQSLGDVRTRYQLTYDAPEPDGKIHKLRVECSRKGVRIEAPQGYDAEVPVKK